MMENDSTRVAEEQRLREEAESTRVAEEQKLREEAENRWGEAVRQLEEARRTIERLNEERQREKATFDEQIAMLQRQMTQVLSKSREETFNNSNDIQISENNDILHANNDATRKADADAAAATAAAIREEAAAEAAALREAALAAAEKAAQAKTAAEAAAARLEAASSEAQVPNARKGSVAGTNILLPASINSGYTVLEADTQSLRHQRSFDNRIPFAVTINSLQKYNGEDKAQSIKVWLQNVEEHAQIYRWDDSEIFLAAKKALCGTADRWLNNQRGILTWNALREALITAFGRQSTAADIHDKLRRRRKRKDETIVAYVYEMEGIGAQGDLPEYEVRQYIAQGVTNNIQMRVTLASATSRNHFLTLLESHERELQRSERYRNNNSEDKNNHRSDAKRKERTCYNCHKPGHIAARCQEKEDGENTGKNSQQSYSNNSGSNVNKKTSSFKNFKSQQVQLKISGNRSNFVANIGGVNITSQFDSGSDKHVMREDAYEFIKEKKGAPKIEGDSLNLVGVGGNVKTLGHVTFVTKIDKNTYNLTFIIVPKDCMPTQVLIGDPMLDIAVVQLSKDGPEFFPIVSDSYIQLIQEEKTDDISKLLETINEKYRDDVEKLLRDYVSSKVPIQEVPIKLTIKLKNTHPIFSHSRRLSPADEVEVRKQIDDWLQRGIIEECESEYASPIVVTRKKNGKARTCIDYIRLNKVVEKQQQPMKSVEETIDETVDSIVHCTLDLKDGFFIAPVDKNSRKYLAFVTPWAQYWPNFAPFGFCESPKIFTKYLLFIFAELIRKRIMIIYMDDMFIKAKNEYEALERLKMVLDVAKKHGLNFSWSKCQLIQRKVEFLGHTVENGTITPSKEKIMDVLNYQAPRTTKQIQRFLGLAGSFRKYIANYANIARPLSDLLKKDAKFAFGKSQMEAFECLKKALSEYPVLRIFNRHRKTELHTDTSKFGYGAILMQECTDDMKMHPVYYMSRKTTQAEKNYHSYELEALAVVRAVEKFSIYLQGLNFKIVTDCAAFQQTMQNQDLKPRLARWVMYLEMFDYKIEHRAGDKMKHVDALSRIDCLLVQDPIVERIKRAQMQDEGLQAIRAHLTNGDYKNYYLDNDLLFTNSGGKRKLVVPTSMQSEIIRRAHEEGHFGTKKTCEKLMQEYHFNNLERKVKNFIKNCITCILAAKKKGKIEGVLNPIPKGEHPLHTWHIDHVGPLPSTSKKYKHLLVIVDGFSKFTWIFATKSTGTKETLDKVKIIQQHFGSPRRIVSDRGTAFTSNDFGDFCKNEDIKHHLITAGVPRGNGQVERINNIIISVFTKITGEKPDKWYKFVGRVQRAINGSFQRAIGTSPYELLFGVKPKSPEDAELCKLIEEGIIHEFEESRSELRKKARMQIDKIQKENAKYYNKNHVDAIQYKEGDIVSIRRTQLGPGLKMAFMFLGPYKVTKILGKDRYEVERLDGSEGPFNTTTSADNMKPWRGFLDDLQPDDNDDRQSSDEESEE